MRKYFICIAAVMLSAFAGQARACDLCAIYRGIEAREFKPGPYLGVFEQYTHYGTLQQDGDEVSNPADQHMDSSITQFIAGYQFSGRAGAQVNLPYIHRSYRRPEHSGVVEGYESGIGDVSLTGSVRLYENLTEDAIFIWTMYGGVKLPTGDSSRLAEELHEEEPAPGMPESGIHGHDLALGSGSYDGIIGTSAVFHYGRLFVSSNLQYAIRTRGDLDYRYANGLYWGVKPGVFLIVTHESTLGLMLAATGETKGRDKFMGRKAQDTGITTVAVGPELSFTWKEKVSADLGADFAVVNENTALQIVQDYRVRAALIWRF